MSNFLEKEFEEVEGISSEKVENYRNQLDEMKQRLMADGLPGSMQLAADANNSSEYLPKKSVKGYKIEALNAKEEPRSPIDTASWKWIVLTLVVLYSIFYFSRKPMKKK